MLLKHVALVCSSENNSDKFYKDLLGLEKKETKILPRMQAKKFSTLMPNITSSITLGVKFTLKSFWTSRLMQS